ncbi:MAG TPA: hypothetical protein P5121_06680 [Caldilineaceae bacterium]|nr:hypothetical protein [Caldilineaceae bacterium]
MSFQKNGAHPSPAAIPLPQSCTVTTRSARLSMNPAVGIPKFRIETLGWDAAG